MHFIFYFNIGFTLGISISNAGGLERLLEVKVVIETLSQCIIKRMAVKDDTVPLVDEASYGGNFKEKSWHSQPLHWDSRRSASYPSLHSYIPPQKDMT